MRLGNTGEGPFEDPECGRPLDLSALRADDALIDALGAGLIRPDVPYEGAAESDRELVAMLAAWVAEVRPEGSEPLSHADLRPALAPGQPRQLAAVPDRPVARPAAAGPATAGPATAGHPDRERAGTRRPGPAARPGVRPAERRRGLLPQFGRRLAVAALLAGLASSGLAVGIGSEPDGASVAVSRVAFADRARSEAAAAQVNDELDVARTALEQGHRAEAARVITSIGRHLPAVRDDDGRARLERDHQRLHDILVASGGPPAASDIVLAAVAPGVEPSDFLGNLADRNDRLGADTAPPAAPAPPVAPAPGQDGTGPSSAILADGPPAATTAGSPAAGGGAAASAGAPTSTASAAAAAGGPPSGSAAGGSSASESASEDSSVPETSPTSAPESSSPESSSPESSTRESSSPESSSPEPTSSESSSPESTKTTTTTKKETTESSPPQATSDAESSAPDTTAVPKPPTSATRTTRPPGESGSASRSASPLPSSQDFIGPVTDRPSQGSPSGAATGRETTSRTSTSRTSASDTSQDSGD